jgi:BTB/POZ domain-containing protein 9
LSPFAAAFQSIGDIQHVANLSEHIGQLYLNEDYSDIELIVDTTTFHAHKVILAVRSEYFRALLYGGMRETSQRRVELVDTNVLAFKMLLRYIYMGRVTLTNLKEDLILDVLGLAHKYGFAELETATSEYLKVRSTLCCEPKCFIEPIL